MIASDRRGFTLIELMIVVVVISILAAMGITNFIRLQDRAREAAVKSNAHTCQLAIEDYGVISSGSYPPAATAMADISALLPGGVVFDNPIGGGAGLSIGAGAGEGMCDYLDPAATGTPNLYRIQGYGNGAALILTLSNG